MMPPRKTAGLTPRQLAVLTWIKGFIRDHGMPPTVREIGSAFGIKSSSAFYLLKELERKGAVKRSDLGARSLIVKSSGRRARRAQVEVPILGRIKAGQPVEAIENNLGTLTVQGDLLRGMRGYALQVVGDSMIDAGILDGDFVVIREQEAAEDGDIVVALIEEEATLKRFYREQKRIRLDAANNEMKPIYVDSGEFRVQGKVVAVHRTL